MKKISALVFLCWSFTLLLIPKVFAGDGVYDVYVIGYNTNYDTFMTNLGGRAGYEYLKAMGQGSGGASSSGGGSAGSAYSSDFQQQIEHDYFCKSQPGLIIVQKNTCYFNASERDRLRQESCSNFSFSYQGVGWTNPCRSDSSLRYRSDTAICDIDYQKNVNSYNAICGAKL